MFTGDLTSEKGKQDYENYIMNNVRNEINSYTKQALASGVPDIIKNTIPVVTYANRPFSAEIGQLIYQSDTNEHLKYVSFGGSNRWMQTDLVGGRNKLINGGFDLWQRGTPIVATGGGQTNYCTDRWAFGNNGLTSFTVSRQTNVPSAQFNYSSRITCDSLSGGLNGFVQFFEDVNVIPLRGKYITVSFWVRCSGAFTSTGSLSTGTVASQNPGVGNGLTGQTTLINVNTNISTSWQYVTYTSAVVVPNTALGMAFYLPKHTFAIGNWIEYAGVQLEVGTAPSEFEFEAYSVTLAKCQRYYAASLSASDTFHNSYVFGFNSSSLYSHPLHVAFPCTMRIVPTLSVTFINQDNAVNGGQHVHTNGFTQYYRPSNSAYQYLSWRAYYSATAEL